MSPSVGPILRRMVSIWRTRNRSTGTQLSSFPDMPAKPAVRDSEPSAGWDTNLWRFSPLGTEAVSVISLRRASRTERKLYEKT
jgi:hypothetical protein